MRTIGPGEIASSLKSAKESGLRYYVSNPCPGGHTVRRTSGRSCVECDRQKYHENAEARKAYQAAVRARGDWNARVAAWRVANIERYRDTAKAWRAARSDGQIAYDKAWNRAYRQAHLEERLAHDRAYHLANREQRNASRAARYHAAAKRPEFRARLAEYRKEHAKEAAARTAAWQKANPGKVKVHTHNRRALKLNAAGSFTAYDINDLMRLQNGKCAYFFECGCRISFKARNFEVDHIVALSKGGTNHRANLQLLCKPCNSRKSAKDPIVFAQELGKLL